MSSPTNPNMAADLPPIGLRRVVYLQANRAPTVLDSKYRDGSYYEFNTEWRDLSTTPPQVWKLAAINSRTDAIWFLLGPGGGPSPAALQFTPTTGSVVYPNATTGNVNVSAGAGITVTGTPETLTIALAGGGTAIDEIAVQAATPPGVTPVDADATGLMTVNGAVVAAHSVPIETHTRALNAYNVEVQRTASSAATDTTSQGLASFKSSQFSVDANGFVSFSTTGPGTTITGDSGGALSPTANNWNILGLSGSKTSGSGSTLTVKSPPFSQVGASATSTLNTGEFVTAAVTRTLPASAGLADGDLIIYSCTTAGALVIQSVGAQKIRMGTFLSSAAGTVTSTQEGDSITLRFDATQGFWMAVSWVGTWIVA